MDTSSKLHALLLIGALLLLTGYHTAFPDPAPIPASDSAPSAEAVASDTVVVFVVWGSSNAGNVGDKLYSPDPPQGTAWEWYWRNEAQNPPRYLDDPFVSRNVDGSSGDGGSAWPSFAVTYNALTGGASNGHVVFMSSLADGGSGEQWNPGQSHYRDGVATITNAMAKARAQFPTRTVVFGGVLWNLSPGLSGPNGVYPWASYRTDLHALLEAFEQDVVDNPNHAGFGGRFYLINTVIPISTSYANPQVKRETDFGVDLEADVCSEFASCSMIQESIAIKQAALACGGGYCGMWYTGDLHWGQAGLNQIGAAAGEVAATDGRRGAFPWEVGVEVPQPIDAAFTTRLKVYDSNGALVANHVIASTTANPDWTADFDGDDPDADFRYDWSAHTTSFLTFEFIREMGGQSEVRRRYVYVPSSVAYPAGETNFFRPAAATDLADVRFEVFADATVKARTGPGGPFYEDAFAGSYVIPYNHAYACGTGCAVEPPGYFLAPVAEVPDATPPLRFTFAREADVLIPPAPTALMWDVPGLELAFPDDRLLIVEGGLDATGVRLTKADGALGWGGVVFRHGASESTLPNGLHDVVVEHVRQPTASDVAVYGAVRVVGRVLTVDDASEIRNSTGGVLGLLASGKSSVAVGEFSVIRDNDGGGLLALGGAQVTVSGQSRVENNPEGGVAARGYGTAVRLQGAVLANNAGAGVQALSNGQVLFSNGDAFPRTRVEGNYGGLDAKGGGLIDAGRCAAGAVAPCPGRAEHELVGNNVNAAYFDARSWNGSTLYAQGNDWNVGSYSALRLLRNGSSVLKVCPMVGASGCPANGRLAGGGWDGSDVATLGGGDLPLPEGVIDVLAIVDEAERAHLAGDLEAFAIAAGAVVMAIDSASTEDDRRAAFEAAARLFAWEQPAGPLAMLSVLAGAPGESQPWARRALGVAQASDENYAGASAVADSLSAAYAGTEHEEYGFALAGRLAVEQEDEARAVAALLALAAAFPVSEEIGPLAAMVAGAFPGVDLSGLGGLRLAGATASAVGGTDASAAALAAAQLAAGALLDVGEARPNPATSTAAVPFVLGAEAQVEAVLYDVLGRRVAVLASGVYAAGRHVATLEAGRLPSGAYVVHVTARGAAGSSAAVRRITLTR